MPTPFMHLQMAEAMVGQIPENDSLSKHLREHWPAFYFGSVAPDYQAISEVARAASHFYHIPPDPNNRAYDRMFATFPELARPTALPPDQALFVAGYAAHLLLDIIWYWDVQMPFFVSQEGLGDLRQRFLIHNVVLTYLDRRAVASLPTTAGTTLNATRSQNWLPFASDVDLGRWQSMLVDQLQPGAPIRTVEIYAGRMGLSPEAFAYDLDDLDWMQSHVFAHVPIEKIEARLASAVAESIAVVAHYFQLPTSQLKEAL